MTIETRAAAAGDGRRPTAELAKDNQGETLIGMNGDPIYSLHTADGETVLITSEQYAAMVENGELDVPHSRETVVDEFPNTPLAETNLARRLDSGTVVPDDTSSVDLLTGHVRYKPESKQSRTEQSDKRKTWMTIGGAVAGVVGAVVAGGVYIGTRGDTAPTPTPSVSGEQTPGQQNPTGVETADTPKTELAPGEVPTTVEDAMLPITFVDVKHAKTAMDLSDYDEAYVIRFNTAQTGILRRYLLESSSEREYAERLAEVQTAIANSASTTDNLQGLSFSPVRIPGTDIASNAKRMSEPYDFKSKMNAVVDGDPYTWQSAKVDEGRLSGVEMSLLAGSDTYDRDLLSVTYRLVGTDPDSFSYAVEWKDKNNMTYPINQPPLPMAIRYDNDMLVKVPNTFTAK